MDKETENGKIPKLKITMMGEIMMTRRFSVYKEPGFLELINLIRESDVSFLNLEGLPGNNKGYVYSNFDTPAFSSNSFIAEELKWAGFNLVSIANNHTMDRGTDNLYSAMNALDKAGIIYSGAGKDLDHARLPGYLELEKGLVALFATSTAEQGVTYYQQHTRATNPGNTYPGRPGLNGIRHDTYYTVDPETFEKIRELKRKFYESNKVSYSYFGRNERLELQRISRPKEDVREEMLFLGNRFVLDKEIKMHFFMHPRDRCENIKIIEEVSKQADWTLATHHTHESKPYYDKEMLPSDFIRKYAHDCIDAGADAYLGHGKHTGQGIEIYKNKPIIYSLANPIYGRFTQRRIPIECFEMVGLGLDSTPLEFMERKNIPAEWLQSLLAVFTLEGDKGSRKLVDFKLYPIDGGADKPYPQFGVRPVLVKNENLAKKIINRYQKLSNPFGTKIEYKNGIGIVKI